MQVEDLLPKHFQSIQMLEGTSAAVTATEMYCCYYSCAYRHCWQYIILCFEKAVMVLWKTHLHPIKESQILPQQTI